MVGMKMEEIAKAALNLLVQEELSNKHPAHSTWSLSSAGLEVSSSNPRRGIFLCSSENLLPRQYWVVVLLQ